MPSSQNSVKIDKLKKYETKTASEPSPEQIKQSKETFVNLLAPMIEKLLKSSETIRPVKESFQELARQAKSGIVRQPAIVQSSAESTLIISGDEKKAVRASAEPTLHNSGGAENSPKIITQNFSDDELKILNSLK